MFTYEFKLSTGDKNAGTVYLPTKESKNLPTIIYCHGWGSNRGGNRTLWQPTEKLCEKAMESNMAFVTFDFFGCGETGGEYRFMTYARWKNNLSDVFAWCMEQPFANTEKIGCYAFSSGSAAALRFAAEESRIAFLVSVGTCVSAHINMVGDGGGPAKILADHYQYLISGGAKELFGIPFGLDFYVDLLSEVPVHKIKGIKCPVLFLQGLADNPYRCADARMAQKLMENEGLSATHVEFQNGNHALENVIDEAMRTMFDWLAPIV